MLNLPIFLAKAIISLEILFCSSSTAWCACTFNASGDKNPYRLDKSICFAPALLSIEHYNNYRILTMLPIIVTHNSTCGMGLLSSSDPKIDQYRSSLTARWETYLRSTAYPKSYRHCRLLQTTADSCRLLQTRFNSLLGYYRLLQTPAYSLYVSQF